MAGKPTRPEKAVSLISHSYGSQIITALGATSADVGLVYSRLRLGSGGVTRRPARPESSDPRS
jgi:hypothetical protein